MDKKGLADSAPIRIGSLMTSIIDESLKNLRRARDEMQEELNRINSAIVALSGGTVTVPQAALAEPSTKEVTSLIQPSRLNNTDMVRYVLADNPKGLPFSDIGLMVKRSFNGHDIKKTSLSPLLTKLRKRKHAKLIDGVWYAIQHAPKSSTQTSFESLEQATTIKAPSFYGGGRPA